METTLLDGWYLKDPSNWLSGIGILPLPCRCVIQIATESLKTKTFKSKKSLNLEFNLLLRNANLDSKNVSIMQKERNGSIQFYRNKIIEICFGPHYFKWLLIQLKVWL